MARFSLLSIIETFCEAVKTARKSDVVTAQVGINAIRRKSGVEMKGRVNTVMRHTESELCWKDILMR